MTVTGVLCVLCVDSRELLLEVLDSDLSNDAFPFSTHKIVNAAGHKVTFNHLIN